MKSDEKIIDNFECLLAALSEGLEERLDDAVDQRGLMNVCAGCVASELVAENETALLQDLYKAGKDDPQLLLSVITKTLFHTSGLQVLLQKILEQSFHLFEEDLPEGGDEA